MDDSGSPSDVTIGISSDDEKKDQGQDDTSQQAQITQVMKVLDEASNKVNINPSKVLSKDTQTALSTIWTQEVEAKFFDLSKLYFAESDDLAYSSQWHRRFDFGIHIFLLVLSGSIFVAGISNLNLDSLLIFLKIFGALLTITCYIRGVLKYAALAARQDLASQGFKRLGREIRNELGKFKSQRLNPVIYSQYVRDRADDLSTAIKIVRKKKKDDDDD
jgi:hypothetical protein